MIINPFKVILTYEDSNPPPFSKLQFDQGSKNETYSCKNETHEIYSFAIRNFGNYSLKIFQPAYQDYDEVLFHIEQGHYYLYSKEKKKLSEIKPTCVTHSWDPNQQNIW